MRDEGTDRPGGSEPPLVYPCAWSYTLIGRSEDALRAAAGRVLEGREHRLRPSRRSRGGRWCSVRLQVVVASERDRHAILRGLRAEGAVRYVL